MVNGWTMVELLMMIFVPPTVFCWLLQRLGRARAAKNLAPHLDTWQIWALRHQQLIALATDIAKDIRARIKEKTRLTASAGVSYNKFLAKLASDHRKPDGLFVITPRMGPAFFEPLSIGRFHGVGPATEAQMLRNGITTGADLRERSLAFLQEHVGKAGPYYQGIARGIDHRPVRANRIRKSVGAENTFATDLSEFEPMREMLQPNLDKVWRHCETTGVRGRTVTSKVKFSDFSSITRCGSVAGVIGDRDDLEAVSVALLRAEMPVRRSVRLLGVSLSTLIGHKDGKPQMILEV